MATYGRLLAAYNDIVGDYGGQGNHVFDIDALNAWAIRLGGTGGHRIDVHAMNEIARLLGGSGGHVFAIDALNEISTRLGGSAGHRMQIDALNIMADLPVGGMPEAETSALIARMSVAPNSTRQGHINTLIKSLKTAGVWSKLDALYVLAAHDAQAAQRNWKQNAFNLTPTNAPTFTIDRGYQGNGTTSYLGSGFDPTTAAGLFAQDSAHLGEWSLTDLASDNADLGNLNARIIPRTATSAVSGRLNQAAAATGLPGVASSAGHTLLSRTASTGYPTYKDGASIGAVTAASTGMTAAPFFVCAANGSTFSTRRIAAAHWGLGLTASEVSALYSALRSYLQAVGAA